MKIFQAGVGSGGMAVLDLLCSTGMVESAYLVDPDCYDHANVVRHYFPPESAHQAKVELAADYIRRRYPNVVVGWAKTALGSGNFDADLLMLAAPADMGVCAIDNEVGKWHFANLMATHKRPWTLGEVLSGGIGGFVHLFKPGGPCYGCVCNFLKRVQLPEPPAPDYSNALAAAPEQRVPASKASIHAIASLHALATAAFARGEPLWSTMLVQLAPFGGGMPFSVRKYAVEVDTECKHCQQTRTVDDGELTTRLAALAVPHTPEPVTKKARKRGRAGRS